MSWQAVKAAYEVDGLDPTARSVLVALAYRTGPNGETWPRIVTLRADTGFSLSTVRAALERLVEAGHVEVIHSPGRSSRYRLGVTESRQGTGSRLPAAGGPVTESRRAGDREPARQGEQNLEQNLDQGAASPPPRQGAAPKRARVGRPVLAIHRPAGGTNGDRADEWAAVDCRACGGSGWVWTSEREVERCRAH